MACLSCFNWTLQTLWSQSRSFIVSSATLARRFIFNSFMQSRLHSCYKHLASFFLHHFIPLHPCPLPSLPPAARALFPRHMTTSPLFTGRRFWSSKRFLTLLRTASARLYGWFLKSEEEEGLRDWTEDREMSVAILVLFSWAHMFRSAGSLTFKAAWGLNIKTGTYNAQKSKVHVCIFFMKHVLKIASCSSSNVLK